MMPLVLVGWLALQAGAAPSSEIRRHVEAGLNAKRAGDLDTAAREFERVVALAPDLAAAHVNLGAVYSDKKDYAKAIPPLRRALELAPALPGAHGMLGIALLAQGYATEAVQHLEQGHMDDLLGVALLEAGRPAEALARLDRALEKRPDDPDLLYYIGQAHTQLSRQVLDRLLAQHQDSARGHQITAEMQAAAGNRNAAEREYRAALALRPELRGVHLALGELYLGAGDYEHAEREFRAESALAPGDARAAYRLGSVLLNQGNTADALLYLKRANELRPDMPETLLELAKAYALAGELVPAEKLLRRLLELEDSSPLAESAHFQLAQLLRKQGKTTDAAREMSRFQELRSVRSKAASSTADSNSSSAPAKK